MTVTGLIRSLFFRGYSPQQIVNITGLPPPQITQALTADRLRLYHVLRVVALRQNGADARTIRKDTGLSPALVSSILTLAREAGVSLPEDPSLDICPARAAAFRQTLGWHSLPTTSTDSTGTTPPPSEPSSASDPPSSPL